MHTLGVEPFEFKSAVSDLNSAHHVSPLNLHFIFEVGMVIHYDGHNLLLGSHISTTNKNLH